LNGKQINNLKINNMDFVGYAKIKQNATTIITPVNINTFAGHNVRVMEFADDGGILCMNYEATGLATIDKEDILTSFKCFMFGEIPVPPNLTNMVEQGMYVMYCNNRKGGYNDLVRNMVIEASLMKGKFCDSMLWQLQDEQHTWKHHFIPKYKIQFSNNYNKEWTSDLQKLQDYVKSLKADCLNIFNAAEILVDFQDGSHIQKYDLGRYIEDNWEENWDKPEIKNQETNE